MSKKPHINKITLLAQSALFTIEGIDLCFSNGQQRCYERVCGRAEGSVMIVPLLDKETLLLIREYAGGVDDYVLGFPKGAVGFGEKMLETANRELMEEVGYGAKRITPLATVSASPGYMTSMMDIVVAEDLYPESAEGDEPEPVEVLTYSLSQIDEILADPQFHEARSIAALLLVQRYLAHG